MRKEPPETPKLTQIPILRTRVKETFPENQYLEDRMFDISSDITDWRRWNEEDGNGEDLGSRLHAG